MAALVPALVGAAFAAGVPEPEATPAPGVEVGLRGVGEVWQDPVIAWYYRSNRFAGTGFVQAPAWRFVEAAVEVGYLRTAANAAAEGTVDGAALELVPVSVLAIVRRAGPAADLYAGAGPALTAFTETAGASAVSGAKLGVEVVAGARIHTSLVQPSMRPDATGGVRGVDLDLFLARRQHHAFGLGSGFDLSAWRLGVGLVARL